MAETRICPYCGEEILAVAKKCKHCGEWLDEKEQIPCPVCGEMIDDDASVCPFCHEKVGGSDSKKVAYSSMAASRKPISKELREENGDVQEGYLKHYFTDVIKNHYADFDRCATRKEYWLFTLFSAFVQAALMCLVFINFTFALVIVSIYSLAVFIPSLAIAVARLRDIGKSWTNLFFALIPIVGAIILLVFMCTQGEKENSGNAKMAVIDYVIIVLAIVGFIAYCSYFPQYIINPDPYDYYYYYN